MKKKMLSAIFSCCMMLLLLPAVSLAADYQDTDGHWGEAAIDRWSGYGIVNGVGNNSFSPNNEMSRAEAAMVFANLLKLNDKADISKYEDIKADAWYAEAIAKCVAAGILNGTSEDGMSPDGKLSREQMMVMLCRAMGIKPAETADKTYADADSVSAFAEPYVNAMINLGFVNGTSDNTMSPLLNINRASVMQVLDNTIGTYVPADGTVKPDRSGMVLIVAENVSIEGDFSGTVVVAKPDAQVALTDST